MKNLKLIAIIVIANIAVACTSKKTVATKTVATKTVNSLLPTDIELKAIQPKYPDVTLQNLNNGYAIYTGACTNCHGMKNLYNRSEESWKHEVDDMAPRAEITDSQKDDLYKYILAMKASRSVTTN
jgi:cytochrome c1